jgi:ABC-type sugar transport system substrate-binding protein
MVPTERYATLLELARLNGNGVAMASLRVRWLFAILAAAVALAMAGCGDDDDAGGGGGGGEAATAEGKTVSILAPLANPFQTAMRNAAEAVAKEHGVEVLYFNNDLDSEAELSAVQDSVNRDVDLVIYGAVDAKVSLAGFRRLDSAGIPIVCFDTCVEEDQQKQYTEAFVTSSNEQLGTFSGEQAKQWIEENVDGTAKLAFVTCNTQSVCRVRYDAQKAALEGVDYEVVADQVALEPDEVKATAEGILQANPDLDLVLTNGTPQTEGLIAAITNLRRDVTHFGIDITEPIAEAMLKPKSPIQSTIGQDGDALGTKMMEIAIEVLEGKKPAQFLYEVDGIIYTKDDTEKIQAYLDSIRGLEE